MPLPHPGRSPDLVWDAGYPHGMRLGGWTRVVLGCLLAGPLVACTDAADDDDASADGPADAGPPRLGRAGGNLTSPGGASVSVPSGALSAPEAIAVAVYEGRLPPPPEGYSFAGDAYAFTPHGATFEAPVTIRIPYTSSRLGKVVLRLPDPQTEEWHVIDDGPEYHKGLATLEVRRFSLYVVAHPGDPAPITCAEGQDACDGRCVDLRTDAGNCGLCRYRCDAACVGGICEAILPADCETDADCDDAQFCNGGETCVDGGCVAGTVPDCDDGQFCNGAELCAGAACAAGTPVDCSDGVFCNGAETCAGDACVAGTPPTCDDGNPQTTDSCSEATMQCLNIGGDPDAGM